jgi:hypothetical protein
MRRRDFIIAFGSVAAFSVTGAIRRARAQQKAKVYRIAVVSPSGSIGDMKETGTRVETQ